MLGDVLLIAEKHRMAAQELIAIIVKSYYPKMVMAISGESGSGKSELAHCIGKSLVKEHAIRTKIIHSDNYYRIHPHLRTEWRKQHGFGAVGMQEIDWKTLNKNIDDFKKSRISEMPCIDIVPDEPDKLITDFSKIDFLIIDGLYALNAKGVDIGVFIDLTYHETKKAQTDRGKEPANDFRFAVLEREHQEVITLKKLARFIVQKDYSVKEQSF